MTDYPQADKELQDRVWEIMRRHEGYDHRIGKKTLTFAVFNQVSDNYERQVRDALSNTPAVWDGGYFIPRDYKEAEKYIRIMRKHQRSITYRLCLIDSYLRQKNKEQIPVIEQAYQIPLLEVVG